MTLDKLTRFLPAISWMFIIFYFSSIPTTSIVGTSVERFIILKSFHLIEYAALAVLLYIGYQSFKLTLFSSYLYALSDELHQYFVPGRTSKFTDTLIDLMGIILGLLIIKYIIFRVFKLLRKSSILNL